MAVCTITVDKDKCDGCHTCVDTCPAAVYEVKGDKSEPVNPGECLLCDACVTMCPKGAIRIEKL